MPITYERSFGGWDQTDPDPSKQRLYRPNPVGSGFATKAQHLEGQLLPNVEVPSHLISSWKDRPPPARLRRHCVLLVAATGVGRHLRPGLDGAKIPAAA